MNVERETMQNAKIFYNFSEKYKNKSNEEKRFPKWCEKPKCQANKQNFLPFFSDFGKFFCKRS